MHLPFEIYDVLERKLGRDDAMSVAKSIQDSLTLIDDESREMAKQRKLEVKEELRIELRDELATKVDIAELRAEFSGLRAEFSGLRSTVDTAIIKLDKKFTIMWLLTMFLIILVNQDALRLMAQLFGLVR